MNETKTLTAQEQRVSELVSKGLSNKKVGAELGITEKTVKFHLTKVYKKLNTNRYDLIRAGYVPTVAVQAGEVATLSANDIAVPAELPFNE